MSDTSWTNDKWWDIIRTLKTNTMLVGLTKLLVQEIRSNCFFGWFVVSRKNSYFLIYLQSVTLDKRLLYLVIAYDVML